MRPDARERARTTPMHPGSRWLFVDDDPDLRDTIRDLAAHLGVVSCVVAGSLSEVQTMRAEILACNVAILDINLGVNAPSGLDVDRWLRAQRFAGTIVFLTGHANDDPRVREAARTGNARVLLKPIGIEVLAALASEGTVPR